MLHMPSLDRISYLSILIVLCFLSLLLLESQSAASFPTYLLALVVVSTFPHWSDVFSSKLAWLTIALVVYLCGSTLWSENYSLRDLGSEMVRGVLILTFTLAFAECQLRNQLRIWLGAALAGCGGLVALGAIALFLLYPPADGRLSGFGQLRNHVVGALVFGAVAVFSGDMLRHAHSRLARAFFATALILLIVAVYFSDSRNAWVSVLVALSTLTLAMKAPDARVFWAGLAALTVCFLALVLGLVVGDSTRELILPRGDSFRIEIWSATLNRVLESPWFGLGIVTNDDVVVSELVFHHPHNMYLSILFQGGIVGGMLFLLLIFGCLRTLTLNYQLADAKLALSLFALALSSFLLDGHELIDKISDTWILFWLPVAISLGISWRSLFRIEGRMGW